MDIQTLAIILSLLRLFFQLVIIFITLRVLYLVISFKVGDKVPFVPSSKKVVKKILDENLVKPGSTLYDLGCGDAKVLTELVKRVQGVKAVGVEKDPIVFPLAYLRWFFMGASRRNLKLILGDIRKVTIEKADVLYLFLLPEFMKSVIIPKIETELKPGTLVLSNMFEIPKTNALKLVKKIEVAKVKLPKPHTQYLYVYQKV